MKKYKELNIILFVLILTIIPAIIYNSYQMNVLNNKQSKIVELSEQNINLVGIIDDLRENVDNITLERDNLSKELEETKNKLAEAFIETQSLSKEYEFLFDQYTDLEERSHYVYNGNWNYEYTEEDIKILAGVIYGENYISGRWEMMLTGSVVLNRILSDKFPNTVYDVVYQWDGGYEQYAPRTKRLIGSSEVTSECYELAELLLKYGPVCPPFVLYQAHRNQGKIYWEWKGEEFCYK